MARITVEDCIDKFPSRFELVLIASNRARKLYSGENPTVEIDNDKNTVIALREIAEETITSEKLKNDLIEEYQTSTFSEDEDLNEIEDNSNENQSEGIEGNINKLHKEEDKDVLPIDELPTESLQDNLQNLSDDNNSNES